MTESGSDHRPRSLGNSWNLPRLDTKNDRIDLANIGRIIGSFDTRQGNVPERALNP